MIVKSKEFDGLKNKEVDVEVTVKYKYPISWFTNVNDEILINEKTPFQNYLTEDLEASLFSDSFGKMPARSFVIESIKADEILDQMNKIKERHIEELKRELEELTKSKGVN